MPTMNTQADNNEILNNQGDAQEFEGNQRNSAAPGFFVLDGWSWPARVPFQQNCKPSFQQIPNRDNMSFHDLRSKSLCFKAAIPNHGLSNAERQSDENFNTFDLGTCREEGSLLKNGTAQETSNMNNVGVACFNGNSSTPRNWNGIARKEKRKTSDLSSSDSQSPSHNSTGFTSKTEIVLHSTISDDMNALGISTPNLSKHNAYSEYRDEHLQKHQSSKAADFSFVGDEGSSSGKFKPEGGIFFQALARSTRNSGNNFIGEIHNHVSEPPDRNFNHDYDKDFKKEECQDRDDCDQDEGANSCRNKEGINFFGKPLQTIMPDPENTMKKQASMCTIENRGPRDDGGEDNTNNLERSLHGNFSYINDHRLHEKSSAIPESRSSGRENACGGFHTQNHRVSLHENGLETVHGFSTPLYPSFAALQASSDKRGNLLGYSSRSLSLPSLHIANNVDLSLADGSHHGGSAWVNCPSDNDTSSFQTHRNSNTNAQAMSSMGFAQSTPLTTGSESSDFPYTENSEDKHLRNYEYSVHWMDNRQHSLEESDHSMHGTNELGFMKAVNTSAMGPSQDCNSAQSPASSRTCRITGCINTVKGYSGLCISHGGGKRCQFEGCTKGADGKTDFCKSHGGGVRCRVEGCEKSAEGRTRCCISHGGGRRCQVPGCDRSARGASGKCIRHGGGKRCSVQDCIRSAEGLTGKCIKHGGGRRCQYPQCDKAAQGGTMFCKGHGGGRRCTFPGCKKAAEGKGDTPLCKAHGGGRRCKFGNGMCSKSVHGGTNFCIAHGGGKRCKVEGCEKSARGRTEFCVRHGGGKRCAVPDCGKSAQGKTDFCKKHGGGKRCSWVENNIPCSKFARCKSGMCSSHALLSSKLAQANAAIKRAQEEKQKPVRDMRDDLGGSVKGNNYEAYLNGKDLQKNSINDDCYSNDSGNNNKNNDNNNSNKSNVFGDIQPSSVEQFNNVVNPSVIEMHNPSLENYANRDGGAHEKFPIDQDRNKYHHQNHHFLFDCASVHGGKNPFMHDQRKDCRDKTWHAGMSAFENMKKDWREICVHAGNNMCLESRFRGFPFISEKNKFGLPMESNKKQKCNNFDGNANSGELSNSKSWLSLRTHERDEANGNRNYENSDENYNGSINEEGRHENGEDLDLSLSIGGMNSCKHEEDSTHGGSNYGSVHKDTHKSTQYADGEDETVYSGRNKKMFLGDDRDSQFRTICKSNKEGNACITGYHNHNLHRPHHHNHEAAPVAAAKSSSPFPPSDSSSPNSFLPSHSAASIQIPDSEKSFVPCAAPAHNAHSPSLVSSPLSSPPLSSPLYNTVGHSVEKQHQYKASAFRAYSGRKSSLAGTEYAPPCVNGELSTSGDAHSPRFLSPQTSSSLCFRRGRGFMFPPRSHNTIQGDNNDNILYTFSYAEQPKSKEAAVSFAGAPPSIPHLLHIEEQMRDQNGISPFKAVRSDLASVQPVARGGNGVLSVDGRKQWLELQMKVSQAQPVVHETWECGDFALSKAQVRAMTGEASGAIGEGRVHGGLFLSSFSKHPSCG